MDEPQTMDAFIGERLREIRSEMGMTQQGFAELLARYGLVGWNHNTVATVELGRRSLSLGELATLCGAFKRAAAHWFPTTGHESKRHVQVNEARSIESLGVHRLLAGDFGSDPSRAPLPPLDPDDVWTPELRERYEAIVKDTREHLRKWWPDAPHEVDMNEAARAEDGVAEGKAARRFDTTPLRVSAVAHALWGRSLTEERDARAEQAAEPGTDRRALQAVRGHVTRQLLEEIEEVVSERGFPLRKDEG